MLRNFILENVFFKNNPLGPLARDDLYFERCAIELRRKCRFWRFPGETKIQTVKKPENLKRQLFRNPTYNFDYVYYFLLTYWPIGPSAIFYIPNAL